MKPENILVITLSNLGDVILTTPVLSVLKGNFPGAKLSLVVGPRAADVVKGSGMLEEVILYDKTISLPRKISFIFSLRKKKYDLVVDLRNTVIPYCISPQWRTSCLRQNIKKHVSKREQHLACLDPLIGRLGIDRQMTVPFDFYSAEEMGSVRKKLNARNVEARDLVAVAAGSNTHLKQWKAEGFAAVADRLAREQKKKIIFLGGKGDSPFVETVLKSAKEKHVNFTGETGFRELAAFLSLCDGLLANDSSPMQLAYEMKVPVVALFGPTDERKYGRVNETSAVIRKELECAPCELAQCRITETKACLNRIEAEEVYQACLKTFSQIKVLS